MVIFYYPEDSEIATNEINKKLKPVSREIEDSTQLPNELSEYVLNKCVKCIKSKRHIRQFNNNDIPRQVFEPNKDFDQYLIFEVTSRDLENLPMGEIEEKSFYETYKIKTLGGVETYDKVPKCDDRSLIFTFDKNNQEIKPFLFALFTQTNHLHYCNFPRFRVLRHSELHRNIATVRLLTSKKFGDYRVEKMSVIIFSYYQDIYFKFPKNEFFNSVTGDDYVLRLKKSSETSFNYILSTQETLKDVLIFGNYQMQQTVVGKKPNFDADYNMDTLINPLGHAVLHTMPTEVLSELTSNEPNPSTKASGYNTMAYAIYKFLKLNEGRPRRKPTAASVNNTKKIETLIAKGLSKLETIS